MKPLTAFLLLTIFLAGCTSTPVTENPTGKGLTYKFNEGEAFIVNVVIDETPFPDTNDIPNTRIQQTLFLIKEKQNNAFIADSFLLDAEQFTDKKLINLCNKTREADKKKTIAFFEDGTINVGNGKIVTNLFIPQKFLNIGDEWVFNEVKYVLGDKTSITVAEKTFNVYKITFSGTVNNVPREGTAFFDYENGKLVEVETFYTYPEGTSDFLYQLAEIHPDYDLSQADLSCANSPFIGENAVVIEVPLSEENDLNKA